MMERQVSVALEGGHGVEDDLEKAFDRELLRIVQFYQKKVSNHPRSRELKALGASRGSVFHRAQQRKR